MAFQTAIQFGYYVRLLGPTDPPKFSHQLCGTHSVGGAACPNCRKPLLLMLSLDTRDARLGLTDAGFRHLRLFLCWSCNISSTTPLFYRQNQDGSITLISYTKNLPVDDFPYPGYPHAFPAAPIDFAPIDAETQAAMKMWHSDEGLPVEDPRFHIVENLDSQDEHLHQIGGYPNLLQWPMPHTCPSCQAEMPFLAAIEDDIGTGDCFNGACAQTVFVYCRRCRTIGVYVLTS